MPTDPTGRISHTSDFHRGVGWKQPVRCATTANGTLATAYANGQTVDGIVLATGDRILLKDQTTGPENGLYTVNLSGAPTRAPDMDQDSTTAVPAEEVMGAVVYVIAGTANAGTFWGTTNTTAPTLGTTAITWVNALTSITGTYVLARYGGKEVISAHGNTGATETFDLAAGNVHTATLDANCTFTFTGATNATACSFSMLLTQDATGSRLVTWPVAVVWPGGTVPTLATAAGSVDILTFLTLDGGTTWYGFPTGSGSNLTIKDEGAALATAATSIDFVGAAVTASGTTAAKTVRITSYEPLTSGATGSPEPVYTADGRFTMVPVAD